MLTPYIIIQASFSHQSMLYLQDGVSQSMRNDIESFDYTWLLELVSQLNWGKEVSNLLLVGMPDVVTPAHFDILENLYVQVSVESHLRCKTFVFA